MSPLLYNLLLPDQVDDTFHREDEVPEPKELKTIIEKENYNYNQLHQEHIKNLIQYSEQQKLNQILFPPPMSTQTSSSSSIDSVFFTDNQYISSPSLSVQQHHTSKPFLSNNFNLQRTTQDTHSFDKPEFSNNQALSLSNNSSSDTNINSNNSNTQHYYHHLESLQNNKIPKIVEETQSNNKLGEEPLILKISIPKLTPLKENNHDNNTNITEGNQLSNTNFEEISKLKNDEIEEINREDTDEITFTKEEKVDEFSTEELGTEQEGNTEEHSIELSIKPARQNQHSYHGKFPTVLYCQPYKYDVKVVLPSFYLRTYQLAFQFLDGQTNEEIKTNAKGKPSIEIEKSKTVTRKRKLVELHHRLSLTVCSFHRYRRPFRFRAVLVPSSPSPPHKSKKINKENQSKEEIEIFTSSLFHTFARKSKNDDEGLKEDHKPKKRGRKRKTSSTTEQPMLDKTDNQIDKRRKKRKVTRKKYHTMEDSKENDTLENSIIKIAEESDVIQQLAKSIKLEQFSKMLCMLDDKHNNFLKEIEGLTPHSD